MRTALYRHFDVNGRLLYVGISLAPINRLAQHDAESCWASKIARVEISYFASREAAIEAEAKSIHRDTPLYNIAHNSANPNRRRRRWSTRDEEPKIEPKPFDKKTCEVSDLLLAYRMHPVLVGALEAAKYKMTKDSPRRFAPVIRAIDAVLADCGPPA